MKLHAQLTAGLNAITAYGADHFAVNGQALYSSFIVTPNQLIAPWSPRNVATLTVADCQQIADLACPIVLLGTGPRQRFPAPDILRPLIEKNIGVEIMDSLAACRTYSILLAEGRQVAVAIMLDTADSAV